MYVCIYISSKGNQNCILLYYVVGVEEPFHHVTKFADVFYVQHIQPATDIHSTFHRDMAQKEEKIDISQEFAILTATLLGQYERKYRIVSTSTSIQGARMKAFHNHKLDHLLESYLIADCLTVLMLPLQQHAHNKYTSVLNALNGLNMDKFGASSLIFVLLNRSIQIFHSKITDASEQRAARATNSSCSGSGSSSSTMSSSAKSNASSPFISFLTGTIAANLFLANKESREIFYQLVVASPLHTVDIESEEKDTNGTRMSQCCLMP